MVALLLSCKKPTAKSVRYLYLLLASISLHAWTYIHLSIYPYEHLHLDVLIHMHHNIHIYTSVHERTCMCISISVSMYGSPGASRRTKLVEKAKTSYFSNACSTLKHLNPSQVIITWLSVSLTPIHNICVRSSTRTNTNTYICI